jgi:hypothetical protein
VHVQPGVEAGAVDGTERLVDVIGDGHIVDAFVVLVQDLDEAVAPAKGFRNTQSVPEGQHGLAVEGLHAEVVQVAAGALPNELVVIGHDKNAVLVSGP